jgi:hypothetical protein
MRCSRRMNLTYIWWSTCFMTSTLKDMLHNDAELGFPKLAE